LLLLPGKAEHDVALPAGDISTELLAAQAHLVQLRQKVYADKVAAGLPVERIDHGRTHAHPTVAHLSTVASQLPAHLGWDSQSATAVLRKTRLVHDKPTSLPEWANWHMQAEPTPSRQPVTSPSETIKLYPDIAIAMLQQEHVAAGRVWLLLRHLDAGSYSGRGWLDLDIVQAQLTTSGSRWWMCGKRQLRNLLKQGEAIFWVRGNGRLWLRSVAHVAAALNVPRLALRPVAVPINVLIQSIGIARAHLYATFHSSRHKERPEPYSLCAPIARTTIAQLTHVLERTQRRYEKVAKVKSKENYAIGSLATAVAAEECTWQHGHAAFVLKDYRGKCGPRPANHKNAQAYMAWQLPNSYAGPHTLQPKGQQKRINHALSDLFMQGMTGNGQSWGEKRFYGNGRSAAQANNCNNDHDIYWYDGRAKVWYCLSAASDKKQAVC
jgi:hypothetical protein